LCDRLDHVAFDRAASGHRAGKRDVIKKRAAAARLLRATT